MKKLIIAAGIASLVGGGSLAWANPEHHAGATAKPAAGAHMHGHKHHAMHCKHHKMHCKHGAGGMKGMSGMSGMSGSHDMMGKGGMDHEHMQQMHDHMGNDSKMGGGMMGGSQMGKKAPTASPTAAPTPAAPK